LKQRLQKLSRKKNILQAICFGVLILLSSCNTTKYLEEGQVLLKKNDTKIDKNADVKKPAVLKAELIQFYKSQPNRKFVWVPREWWYYRNQNPGDTTWFKKWAKNKLGEEPVLLDTTLVSKTSLEMQNYLRNKKGYYQAVVTDSIIYKNKKAEVEYYVTPNQQYTVNSIEYFTLDSILMPAISSIQEKSLIKAGDPIDAFIFNVEKQRIVTQLQDEGFANFNLKYVSIKGDSTKLDHAWDIFYEILPPSDSTSHERYRVGDLNIYTDYNQSQSLKNLKSYELNGKKYFRASDKFLVRPTTIDGKIFLNKYDQFNTKNYEKTVQKLFNLNAYRFIKLDPRINPEDKSLIDYNVLMTPQKYRWAYDLNNNLFYSNRTRAPQNLVGFSVGGSLENRNTFGGSEKFKISAETGFEFVVVSENNPNTGSGFINTFSLGINNTLDIPKFTSAFNVLKFSNKLGIVKDKTIQTMEEEATSRISLGYNLIDIINDYRIFTISTSYGYDIRLNNKNRIVFNQTGFEYAEYDIRQRYQMIIDSNIFLKRSFQNTLFTGLLIKNLSYYYQTDNGPSRPNWAFIFDFEISGLEIHALNGLYNGISGSSSNWKLNNGIAFEKMFKIELDGRWFKNITKNSQLAARLKTGFALPYGLDDSTNPNVVSFIKQFLVGGPNSIRAWRPMSLGPGTYINPAPANTNNFYQRGDILLEFNLEYRFDLFWLMEGGLFLDGGNIWTLRSEVNRPGSQFSSDFYKQLALGYGWGIRFDFDYFLIRFDFGYKLRNPFLDPVTDSYFVPLKGQGVFGNFNVAVNYPF